MKTHKIRNSILLILTALIWGTAFVSQSTGGDAVGPYAFNCIRFWIGGIVLLPVIKFLDFLKLTKKPTTREEKKLLLKGGICCGCVLFLASTSQQLGIYLGTGAGKAGFLTACYILLVPIFGLALKKRCPYHVWISVVIAVVGLYFLCIKGTFALKASDALVLVCAMLYAVHILTVDHFAPMVCCVRMSCIQFLVVGVLGIIPAFILDMGGFSGILEWSKVLTRIDAWQAILFAGVMSSGVAYTLQIVGQNGLNPTVASLLMSLESVFSVLAGFVILGDVLSSREIIGCVLVFAAIIFAQLPINLGEKAKKK